ncbi:flagellin [Salimicrobium jeotgali]|uniref:Flagellin n=1 Tax=Salimicrobium jeotgali TaxID=1230341 RepID=K2GD37_9BACI|nr:flagellin [Salimicrobium jeotgali]AKG03897.1 flagellin [Salimicrobium jeotgali]EKE32928.1 flagellin [Salimicrobium jeotgali]MBM7695077.1 flagellin [Salimicrobium jeotgali]
MRINHNIAALNTHRQLGSANNAQQNSMEKLSSGLRINSAKDDAAGLAISEKMRGQIRGLDMASKNAQDANSMIQTAEGALNETHDILQRMRELGVQASNDTNTTADREEIQKEVNQLTSEINRIGNTTEFNTQKLLNGSKDESTGTTPGQVSIGSLDFDFSAGSELNGWTVETGTVTNDTSASASIDTTNQKIVINGDFDDTTAGMVAAGDLQTEINNALSTAGFTQTVSVTGTATDGTSTGVSSSALTGGTDAGSSLQFQIGANENQSLTLDISDMRADNLGLTRAGSDAKFGVTDGTNSTVTEMALDVTSHTSAADAVTKIQSAIDQVSAERSKLGATQNRLDHSINNLNTSSENLTAAESRIRDVDMAKEMMNQTKQSILSQASQAMLAKANQQPQGVLQLLR